MEGWTIDGSGSVPDGSVPDGSVPDGSVPDGSVPDGSVPDGSVPDGSVPDGSVPDGSVPDGSVPDGDSSSRNAAALTNAVLRDATDLLRAELPDPRLADDTAYLRWCYRDNPLGRAWERYHYVDADHGAPMLVAHYLIMPRRYRGPGGVRSDGAWSQHAVTRSGYQRARHFTRLGLEIYADAGSAGRSFAVGVTNAKSTGAVVKYMGWRLVGPLPVRVVPPLVGLVAAGPGRRRKRPLASAEVTERWLESREFEHFAGMVDRHAVAGWSTDWSSDVLRWRLACPFARYWVHVFDDAAVVSTKSSYARVPATVVLKLFPLAPQTAAPPGRNAASAQGAAPAAVDATGAISAVARRHRSAFAVYAGFNSSVRVRGMAPPRRLQPSPLNLIARGLSPEIDQDSLALDTFELLDMDAY